MEVSVQLHALVALSWGKELWYPLNRRLGGLRSRSGCFEEEEKFLPLPGIAPRIFVLVA